MREAGGCKGRFEKTGVCGRQEYARVGLRKHGLYGDISQKTPIFITAAVRISNPTYVMLVLEDHTLTLKAVRTLNLTGMHQTLQ
jgi:hypothetical protein